ncbi:hypothetical protein IT408_03030 [Candidatus Uhrbacteria bacterium]|nr:hypothetical protein [Candidatus Uhrbacteria bacterium]
MSDFRFRLSFVFCGLLLATSVCFVRPASALTVSPTIFDETTNPGSSLKGTITLTNETDAPQTYYTSVQNFVAEGEDGRQKFLSETDKTGLATWLKPGVPSLSLKAGESRDVSWSLDLPSSAEPGGHYAAVFFSTQPPSETGVTVGIGAKLGVLFLVNVNGEVKENAVIESFRVTEGDSAFGGVQTSFLSHIPADFELRIRNQGSVHLKPSGTIDIQSIFGRKAASVNVNPLDSKILPNSIRRVRSVWGPTDLSKDTGFVQGLKNEWRGFAFGRYTAKAQVEYGLSKQRLDATVSFWVFPWRLVLVIGGFILLLVLSLKAYNRMVISSAMGKKR